MPYPKGDSENEARVRAFKQELAKRFAHVDRIDLHPERRRHKFVTARSMSAKP
jgi:hypothetical protein